MSVSDFNTPTKRERLAPKPEPYWFKISKGRFIGYRKGKNAGSWVARAGKKISTISDDGAMDYDEALKEVITWCERETIGGNRKYLLQECIADYVKDLARRKKGQSASGQAERRMSSTLNDAMKKTEVSKLTTATLEDWLHDLDMHESSANRTYTTLRAALNLAFRRGIVPSDQQWRRVQPFKKADRRRELFLTDKQVADLLDAAETPALHDLMKAGVLTGARCGELRAVKVKHLDPATRSLKLKGKTGERDCYLSADALAFFQEQAKSKLPEAPLLMDEYGGAWSAWLYVGKVRAVVKRAKLPPETVYYSLRHYHISKAVGAGLSLLAIARNTGTSVAMIEKHYGKFTPQNMAEMMDRVELGGAK